MSREKGLSQDKIKQIADKASGRYTEPGKRPLEFRQETADVICERIADGQSLREICLEDNMPARSTVFKWLSKVTDFADQYARAREAQADTLFDEILDIADDSRNDWIERKGDDGSTLGVRENGEALKRSQLRVDARKWMAGKLRPKKYSDKLSIDQTTTHEAGDTLQTLMERIAENGKRIHSDS